MQRRGEGGVNGDGAGMGSGASGLLRLKEAMKQMKKEIMEMNVTLGVLAANLQKERCVVAVLIQKNKRKGAGRRKKHQEEIDDFSL